MKKIKDLDLTENQKNEVLKAKANITREEEAKLIVLDAFRNGLLEDIHAGDDIPIPKSASRISQEEMKELMKYAVDKVNYILWMRDERPKNYIGWYVLTKYFSSVDKWDAPRDPEEMHKEMTDALQPMVDRIKRRKKQNERK